MYRKIIITGDISNEQVNFITENLGNKKNIKINISISHDDFYTNYQIPIILNGKNCFLTVKNMETKQ